MPEGLAAISQVPRRLRTLLDKAVDSLQDMVAAEDFHQMIKAGADGAAGAGETGGVDHQTDLNPQVGRDFF